MQKIHILAITPYDGLNDMMEGIAAKRDNVSLTLVTADPSNRRLIEQYLSNAVDVIVTCSGAAETLREYVSIPIYEISFSAYDILRAIRLAQNFSSQFALIGSPETTAQAKLLCNLLQYDIHISTVKHGDNIHEFLLSLQNSGISVVVGDSSIIGVARQLGMTGILILFGIESIEQAFDQATLQFFRYDQLKSTNRLLEQIIEEDEDLVFVINASGNIIYSNNNQSSGKILQTLYKLLPDAFVGESIHYHLRNELNSYTISSKLFHYLDEQVCLFRVAKRSGVDRDKKFGVRYLNHDDAYTPTSYSEWGNSATIQNLLTTAEKYARTNQPILIIGEIGTNKDLMAKYIYQKSHKDFNNRPLVLIDFNQASERQIANLLEDSASPIFDTQITLLFRGLNCLTVDNYRKLIAVLNESNCFSRNRLLFVGRLNATHNEETLAVQFTSIAERCLTIKMPPLREHLEDIPQIISQYINSINMELGTQVVGLSTEAMALCQQMQWPQNINQLYRVVKELTLNADSYYISADAVAMALEKENRTVHPELDTAAPLDFSKPLRDIERDIVKLVLQHESMNQSKAAKRLNISRSTLWRIMKE